MKLFNLLNQKKIFRKNLERSKFKEENRKIALKFDKEYFDGTRDQGYGGYKYDGRWISIAKRAIKTWKLENNAKILDIGCAKGFFLEDLYNCNNSFQVYGLDISRYAINQINPELSGVFVEASCETLPFPDNSFDAVFAINTIHNLELRECKQAIKEIERVAPGRGFIQVDAYRTEEEREVFMEWMLTAKSFNTPYGWKKIFKECGYTGYYYWTIIESNLEM